MSLMEEREPKLLQFFASKYDVYKGDRIVVKWNVKNSSKVALRVIYNVAADCKEDKNCHFTVDSEGEKSIVVQPFKKSFQIVLDYGNDGKNTKEKNIIIRKQLPLLPTLFAWLFMDRNDLE